MRRHALTSMILPKMLYGAELWGMNGVRSVPAQRVADRAMRLLLSIGGSGASLSLNAMREELGLVRWMQWQLDNGQGPSSSIPH